VRLANTVFYPDGGLDMGNAFPSLFASENAENLRIVLVDGEPVSLAGFLVRDMVVPGARLRAACIGSVCTLERWRGRGLAASLMEDAVSHAVKWGASVALISGGRGLYRRMGCIDAGLYRVVRAGATGGEGPADVREWSDSDLPRMRELHDEEPVRFERTSKEMRLALQTSLLQCRPARSWVSWEQGRGAAYLCVEGSNDVSGPGVLQAREIAGSRRAVLRAAPVVLRQMAASVLEIETTASDAAMAEAAAGMSVSPMGFHGTVKVIDPAALFRSLEGRTAALLAAEDSADLRIHCGREVRLRVGSEELVLDNEADVTALVFGSVERAAPAPAAGRLSKILARLFPVPLPCYGLSYV
jgi:GNAT superfamily N-acetyltransferase